MPNPGKTQSAMHARSLGPRLSRVAAITLVMAGTILAEAHADGRSRGTSTSGISSRSAQSRPATSPGRYRSFGHVRGGTGAPPVRQPNLPHALSGLGTVQHIERSRQRFHAPPAHHVGHHRPRVIFVPVGFAQPSSAQDQIIVVQQAPQPLQPIIITVLARDTGAATNPAIPPPPPAPPRRTSTEPGTLRFVVQPADAEIVLDDLRLGTPKELLATGRRVAPGIHVLEITHPAHVAERIVFAIEPGGSKQVSVDLRETRPSRRTRIE